MPRLGSGRDRGMAGKFPKNTGPLAGKFSTSKGRNQGMKGSKHQPVRHTEMTGKGMNQPVRSGTFWSNRPVGPQGQKIW